MSHDTFPYICMYFIYDEMIPNHPQLLSINWGWVSIPIFMDFYLSVIVAYFTIGYGTHHHILNLSWKQLNKLMVQKLQLDDQYIQCRQEHHPWQYSPKNKSSTEKTSWNGISQWHNYLDWRDSLDTLTELSWNLLYQPQDPLPPILPQFIQLDRTMMNGCSMTNSLRDTSPLTVLTFLDLV